MCHKTQRFQNSPSPFFRGGYFKMKYERFLTNDDFVKKVANV